MSHPKSPWGSDRSVRKFKADSNEVRDPVQINSTKVLAAENRVDYDVQLTSWECQLIEVKLKPQSRNIRKQSYACFDSE